MTQKSGRDRQQQPQRVVAGSRRNGLLWAGLGILAVAIFAAIFTSMASQRQPGAPSVAASGVIGTRVGDTAPDFRLIDINRVTVTRSSLVAERPGLMFFTATWCLPCIEGLMQLMKFQGDIGGTPFNVLVVFVDPKQTDNDLREYRDRFGFPKTWYYALDGDNMVKKYGLRYLDTKYVLNRSGTIHYTDFYPADYNTWVRALATVGIGRRSGQ
ncbi:MAG: TlpA family protein disulfide reductase [Armatimonadota bacterium]